MNDSGLKDWDVIIAGGGPAGVAAAITLAEKGRSVLLLEKHQRQDFKLGESLPPVALPLLQHYTGILTESVMAEWGMSKSTGNISCWDSQDPQRSDFFFSATGYGIRLNRAHFDHKMRDCAVSAGVCVMMGSRVKNIKRDKNWHVDISFGDALETCHAKYLIDCTGRQSIIAGKLGVKKIISDNLFAYAQCYYSGKETDRDTETCIEAAAEGWWYSVRLDSCKRLVVFHTDKDLGVTQSVSGTEEFDAHLASSIFIDKLLKTHAYQAVGKLVGAPAYSARLERYTDNNWLAVGDAAQSFDPLSSQGIYMALRSGSFAGQSIDRALTENNPECLGKYAEFMQKNWNQYIQQHNYYYQSQSRWPDSPFWKRRRSQADSQQYRVNVN